MNHMSSFWVLFIVVDIIILWFFFEHYIEGTGKIERHAAVMHFS